MRTIPTRSSSVGRLIAPASRRRPRTLLLLGLALATVVASRPALADGAADASVRFRRGVELYQERDYEAAILEFQRAYDTVPNFRVLYNIAQAYAELQDYVSAHDTYTRYLAEGGSEILPDRAKEVAEEIERMRGRIATVRLETNVSGATISVDDVERGVSPLGERLRVSAGQHRVAASRAGYLSASRTFSVAGGDELEVHLDLTPSTEAIPARTPPEGQWRGPGTPFWALLATTGTLAVGAAVAGGLSVAQGDSHETLRRTRGVTLPEIDESADELARRTITTDVLLAATSAAAIVTVVLAFTTSSGDTDGAPATTVVVRPGSVCVHTSF